MPYYDATKVVDLRARDLMRDLLEGDNLVRAVYPAPKQIYRLPTNSISRLEDTRVCVVLGQNVFGVAATLTNERDPIYALSVQKFCSTIRHGTPEEEDALDAVATISGNIQDALLRYQRDPTSMEGIWHSFSTVGASRYDQANEGFYFALTYFSLHIYRRNP